MCLRGDCLAVPKECQHFLSWCHEGCVLKILCFDQVHKPWLTVNHLEEQEENGLHLNRISEREDEFDRRIPIY